jgi:hypothetical protein
MANGKSPTKTKRTKTVASSPTLADVQGLGAMVGSTPNVTGQGQELYEICFWKEGQYRQLVPGTEDKPMLIGYGGSNEHFYIRRIHDSMLVMRWDATVNKWQDIPDGGIRVVIPEEEPLINTLRRS